jgi:gas vesicle protein
MLRVINLSRAQPAARNLSLITKRYQQSTTSSGSSTTQSATKTPPSATKTQTASTTPSSKPVPPPSSSSSYPSGSTGGSGGTVKAIVYGVALGLGVTLLYAEYDNGSFRHKVESTLPLSSTILSGLDKIIDPVFGRHKKLTTIISEKLPDVSAITNKLPDKEQIKKAGEQVKDTVNDAYDKLPEYKKIKGAVTHAADQVKEAVHTVRDALPDPKAVKKSLTHAKEQVEDTAKSVRDTVKDALPTTKGLSGEQSRRGNDPVFLEEPGEVATPPPIKRK